MSFWLEDDGTPGALDDVLAEANLSASFTEYLHPRDFHGRWTAKLSKATPRGQAGHDGVSLPDGTRIQRHASGDFAVSRNGRITRHPDAASALDEALLRSARGKEAESLGGATRHQTVEAASRAEVARRAGSSPPRPNTDPLAEPAQPNRPGASPARQRGVPSPTDPRERIARAGMSQGQREARTRRQEREARVDAHRASQGAAPAERPFDHHNVAVGDTVVDHGGGHHEVTNVGMYASGGNGVRRPAGLSVRPAGGGRARVMANDNFRGHIPKASASNEQPAAPARFGSAQSPDQARYARIAGIGSPKPAAQTPTYSDARAFQGALTTKPVRGRLMPDEGAHNLGSTGSGHERLSLHEVSHPGGVVGYIAKERTTHVVARGGSRIGQMERTTDLHVYGPTGKRLMKIDARNGMDGAKRALAEHYHSSNTHQISGTTTTRRMSSFGSVQTREHASVEDARKHLGLAPHVAFTSSSGGTRTAHEPGTDGMGAVHRAGGGKA